MRRCPSVSLLFPYTTLFRSPSSHAFRLSWRGSLHIRGPLTIRLAIKPDGSGIATIKIWKLVRVGFRSGSPEYKYCLETDLTKLISKRSVKKLLQQMEKVRFWDLPSHDNRRGLDGE